MAEFLSYAKTLEGVVAEDDIEGLCSLVEQHKNWGAFKCRVPSYIIVRLIDALRDLRQHGAEYYETSEDVPADAPEGDDEDAGDAPF
jgi:hypothetical protein